MKTIILVIDDSDAARLKPFSERYKVFDVVDQRRAIEHAEKLGYGEGSCFTIPFNLKPGVMNVFSCGDTDVKLIVLEVQE